MTHRHEIQIVFLEAAGPRYYVCVDCGPCAVYEAPRRGPLPLRCDRHRQEREAERLRRARQARQCAVTAAAPAGSKRQYDETTRLVRRTLQWAARTDQLQGDPDEYLRVLRNQKGYRREILDAAVRAYDRAGYGQKPGAAWVVIKRFLGLP